MKPIRDAIESLQAKGLCPRLHIDVTHAEAVCPDFVRDKWQQQLVIDLDPSYPLDLAFTKVGVEADLSFGGYVTRCVFPWPAIYVVSDRATGRGQVFASNVPASLRERFGVPPEPDRELTKVRDDDKAKPGSRRRKRRGEPASEPEPAIERPPARVLGLVAVADEAEDTSEPVETEAAPEDKPAAPATPGRRSPFKVIDGGG
jgi:stringent starvation protein B